MTQASTRAAGAGSAALAAEYDVIVVGGGINGLTAATYLQKSGLRVACFERKLEAGAGCCTEEVLHPGVKVNLCACNLVTLWSPVYGDLELEKFGLEMLTSSEWGMFHPFKDRSAVLFHSWNPRKQYEHFASIDAHDAEVFKTLYNTLAPGMSDALQLMLFSQADAQPRGGGGAGGLDFAAPSPPPGYPGERPRTHGHRARRSGVPEREDPHRAAHQRGDDGCAALEPGRGRAHVPPLPRHPGHQQRHLDRARRQPRRHARARARASPPTADGSSPAARWRSSSWRATRSAEWCCRNTRSIPEAEVRATRAVVSNLSCHPTFLGLIGEERLPDWVERGVREYQYDEGMMFTNYWVLDRPPRWEGYREELDSAYGFNFGLESVADIRRLERNLAANELPDPPIVAGLSVQGFSLADRTQAPQGQYTAMAWSCVPYELPAHGGPEKWDQIREDYGDRVDRLLAEYNPGMMDSVVARYCNSPLDYFRKNPSQVFGATRSGSAGGRWFGTARPFPGCGAPRTPFGNLYLSNSIWPVGTSTLGAGYVAATEIAKDLGVRDGQAWWRYRALEAGTEVLRRRGIEIARNIS